MVKYLEDRSGNNQKTLTSKISQKKLENAVQYQLETEVKQLPDLCQLLESVTTARDFLLEIGGSPDRSLVDFMVSWTHHNIIRLIRLHFLQTRLQLYVGEVTNIRNGPLRNFRLCHVDSLISFLLLVRAKIMIRNEQNPFDQVSIIFWCMQ